MKGNPKSPLPPSSGLPSATASDPVGKRGEGVWAQRFFDAAARVLERVLSRLFPVAGQGDGAGPAPHSSVGRMTLKSFFREHRKPGFPFWCDLMLESEHDAAHVAAWLSDVFALRFHPLNSDNYQGFQATLDDHVILLLEDADDSDGGGCFSFNIQPGPFCRDEGPVLDLEEDMRRWLSAGAAAAGVSIMPH